MTTEFTVEVPGVGKVDVDRQSDGQDANGNEQFFWDLFDEAGSCLNEGNPFWTKPTENEVLTFFKNQ